MPCSAESTSRLPGNQRHPDLRKPHHPPRLPLAHPSASSSRRTAGRPTSTRQAFERDRAKRATAPSQRLPDGSGSPGGTSRRPAAVIATIRASLERQPLALERELRDLAQGEPAGLRGLVGDPELGGRVREPAAVGRGRGSTARCPRTPTGRRRSARRPRSRRRAPRGLAPERVLGGLEGLDEAAGQVPRPAGARGRGDRNRYRRRARSTPGRSAPDSRSGRSRRRAGAGARDPRARCVGSSSSVAHRGRTEAHG